MSARPRSSTRSHDPIDHTVTAEDRQRHQHVVRTIYEWMTRTRATQQALRACVQEFWRRRGESDYVCDHTLLSRILNPVQPYVPTPGRPKAMRIVQAAMIICSAVDDPNLVATACDGDLSWSSDEEQAFKIHRARLRHLREQGRTPLHQALHRLGEFVAAAAWMDDSRPTNDLNETYRQRAAENTLLTLAAVVDPGPSMRALAERLTAEGVEEDEVRRLVAEQIGRVDRLLELFAETRVNLAAYGSMVLFHCGRQERGMQLLMQAVAGCRDEKHRHDPHWQTLLELLDRLLERPDTDTLRWSRQAAALADKTLQGPAAALLREAWSLVAAPRVAEHWSELNPALIDVLRGRKPAGGQPVIKPPAPPAGGRRRAKLMSAMIAALASLMLGGTVWAMPATSSRSITREAANPAPVLLAIRGREAKNGQPPPPPPPPPAATARV